MAASVFDFKNFLQNPKRRDLAVLLGTVLVLIAIPVTVYLTLGAREPTSKADTPEGVEEVSKKAKEETQQILRIAQGLKTTDTQNSETIKKEIKRLAASRKKNIVKLAEQDPKTALALSLPEDQQTLFVEGLTSDIEETFDQEGVYISGHEDYFDKGEKRDIEAFQVGSKVYKVKTPKEYQLKSGQRLRFKGFKYDDLVLVNEILPSRVQGATTWSLGPQKVAGILIKWSDDTTEYTNGSKVNAQDKLLTQMANFYNQSSFSKTSITGDIYGWITVALPKSTCNGDIVGQFFGEFLNKAMPVVDFTQYNNVYWIVNCPGLGGAAYVGRWITLNDTTGSSVVSMGFFSAASPLSIYSHEFGHGLYAGHANSWDCGTVMQAPTGCTSTEYGDIYSVMGSSPFDHTAHHKDEYSWLDNANMTTLMSSGTFNIVPYQTNGIKAVRIPKKLGSGGTVTEWYYLEYRQRIGVDATISTAATNGALLRFGNYDLGAFSFLIDGTPATSSFSDATLTAGRVFDDTSSGVRISVDSVTATNLSGTVTLTQSCARANPTVTLSPQAQWGNPGQRLSYTATIRNNDSSTCAPSGFNLSVTKPTGWTSTLTPSSVNLNPGAQTDVTEDITSPTTASANVYNFTVVATSSTISSFVGNASATYTVNAAKVGDINGDNQVNSADLSIVISTWGSTTDLRADLNGDGRISSGDLAQIISRWGT